MKFVYDKEVLNEKYQQYQQKVQKNRRIEGILLAIALICLLIVIILYCTSANEIMYVAIGTAVLCAAVAWIVMQLAPQMSVGVRVTDIVQNNILRNIEVKMDRDDVISCVNIWVEHPDGDVTRHNIYGVECVYSTHVSEAVFNIHEGKVLLPYPKNEGKNNECAS